MKKDVYETITNHIINSVDEAGKWSPPWHGMNGASPMNAVSKHLYQGVNILTCWVSQAHHDYPTQEWATFNQWKSVGGKIRKGEKGTPIIFYKAVKAKSPDEKGYLFARSTHVFNRAQQDGAVLPSDSIKELEPKERIDLIEAWFEMVKREARVNHTDEGRAYYSMTHDKVVLPHFQSFIDAEHYYSVAFHELTHWTGHKARLDRLERGMDKEAYAKEELVAELGAAFLSSEFGIVNATRDDHTNYIAAWLKALKNDKTLIVKAASQASKAVAYLQEAAKENKLAA